MSRSASWERRRVGALCAASVLGLAGAAAALKADPGGPVDARWSTTVAALVAISVAADLSRSRKAGWLGTLDASFIVGLVALVLAGPLAAVVAVVTPDLTMRLLGRRSRRPDNLLVSVVALAVECLVGAAVLRTAPGALTSPTAIPALFTAGVAMVATSFLLGPAVYALVHGAASPRAVFRPFMESLPVELGLALCGTATALASGPLGVFALLTFVFSVELPRLVVGRLTQFSTVHTVDRATARGVYARALADVLVLSRHERRVLNASLTVLAGGVPRWMPDPPTEVTEVLLHVDERWDGDGGTAGLPGVWTPRIARIIAVAEAWSAVTARDTAGLDHDEALLGLASGAGTRFDPEVVDAAAVVVAAEAPYARQRAFLPRLHTLPVPRMLRRGALPRVLRAVTDG